MKINMILPKLPDTAPQIIRDSDARIKELAKPIPALLKSVVRRYRSLMTQNALFIGKLHDLIVTVHPFFLDDETEHSFGEFTQRYENGKILSIIELNLNLADSPKYNAYIFAHELTHMLLGNQMDHAELCRVLKPGLSGGGSCVNAILTDSGCYCGTALEESMADYAASYVISRMRLSDAGGTYATNARSESRSYYHLQEFAPLLASAFGDSLMDCRYLDEFSYALLPPRKPASPEDSFQEDEQLRPRQFACSTVRNYFWYCAVVNGMHPIVDQYEEMMGDGSWIELCRCWDTILFLSKQEDAQSLEELLLLKIKGTRLLQEFQQKMEQADSQE